MVEGAQSEAGRLVLTVARDTTWRGTKRGEDSRMSTPPGRSDPQRDHGARTSTLAADDAQSVAGRGGHGLVPLGLSRPGMARTAAVTLLVAVPALVLRLWVINA